MNRMLQLLLVASVTACGCTTSVNAQGDAQVKIVADQVRAQGHACNSAVSAELIEAESEPDQPVYLLTCDNAAYKVRIIPDMAAEVTVVQ